MRGPTYLWPTAVRTRHGVEQGRGMRGKRRLAIAAVLLAAAGSASHTAAHHPGGESEPLVLIDSRKEGYRAVLEVYPPAPLAGSPTQFMLWVTPERWGYEYRGNARLWIREPSPSSTPPMVVPMPEEGRRAGVYLTEHRFPRGGTYRVEVELANLPSRWSASLRVDSAMNWILKIVTPLAFGVLVLAFLVFLGRWSRPGRTTR